MDPVDYLYTLWHQLKIIADQGGGSQFRRVHDDLAKRYSRLSVADQGAFTALVSDFLRTPP